MAPFREQDRLKPATGTDRQRRDAGMARPAVLTVADTIAKSFLLAVETRGDKPAIREKKFGIWQPTSWRAVAADLQGHRLWPPCDRLPARRRRLHHRQRGARMGVRRYGHPLRRRRLVRHLPDRFGGAGRISRQRFPHPRRVRRGRGATRQAFELPLALPDAGKDHRVRHGGPERLLRPDGDVARRIHGARAQPRPGPRGAVGRDDRQAARRPISPSSSTPRAPPARPRARCIPTAA